LTGFDVLRTRARRAWRAARGRIEDGRRPDLEGPRGRAGDGGLPPGVAAAGAVEPLASPVGAAHGVTVEGGAEGGQPGRSPLLGYRPAEDSVPHPVRVAAGWSWRLIVIVIAIIGFFYLIGYVQAVVIPVIIALLLSAMLQPGAAWLRRHGVPRSLAAGIMLITGIVVVSGVLTGVITSFVNGFPDLSKNVVQGVQQIVTWLHNGPLHVSDKQIGNALKTAQTWMENNQGKLTSGALSTATSVGEALVDIFLILLTTFFLVRDGRAIWNFLVQLLPRAARPSVDDAGTASWQSLVAYVRATVLVAFIDAVCIGIGIKAVGVPWGLAIPLAALIFLGAFIPIVGATLSGTVAILVTLVTRGLIAAIIVLAIVLAVQQIEGHLLQPLIMGRAVAIHPLGIILGIAAGIAIFGIFGGLIAVPLIAVLNTAIRRLVARSRHAPEPPEPPGEEARPTELPPPQAAS
jgi:predicted PurR-regulated permease PerM